MAKVYGISAEGRFMSSKSHRTWGYAFYGEVSGRIAHGTQREMQVKINSAIKKYGLDKELRLAEIVELPKEWAAAVKEAKASDVKYAKMRDGMGTLQVRVLDDGSLFITASSKKPTTATKRAIEAIAKGGGRKVKSTSGHLGVVVK